MDINYNDVIRAHYEQFESLMTVDLAYFLGTDTKHISIWQVKPDGGRSVVYFRYLFDVDDEDETQIVGGDIMVLARSEIADDSSTAQRGFLMKYTDSSYDFVYCIPTKEECDPSNTVNMNRIFAICFFASFAFEIAVYGLYRLLTRGRRQRQYEEKLKEQHRVLRAMEREHATATRVGMKDVAKKRAKKIAMDRATFKELHRNHVSIDEAKSLGAQSGQWATQWNGMVISESDEENEVEMAPYGNPEVEHHPDSPLPAGWERHETEDGEQFYLDTVSGRTQWNHPAVR